MKEITIESFREFLQSEIFDLHPTQQKICFPIIQRIHLKMAKGVKFENINVKEGLLIDGHHRYLCSLLRSTKLGQNAWVSPSKTNIFEWSKIDIDLHDWESEEMIRRHNLKDAAKSGLNINDFDV